MHSHLIDELLNMSLNMQDDSENRAVIAKAIDRLEFLERHSYRQSEENIRLANENRRLRRINKHWKDIGRRIMRIVNMNGPYEFKDAEEYIKFYTRLDK